MFNFQLPVMPLTTAYQPVPAQVNEAQVLMPNPAVTMMSVPQTIVPSAIIAPPQSQTLTFAPTHNHMSTEALRQLPIVFYDFTNQKIVHPNELVSAQPETGFCYQPNVNVPIQFDSFLVDQSTLPFSPSVTSSRETSPEAWGNVSVSTASSPYTSPCTSPMSSTCATKVQVPPKKRKRRRKKKKTVNPPEPHFSHRSKQDLIESVYAVVTAHYKNLNLLTERELRGETVARVHVKSFHGLKQIQRALSRVDELNVLEEIALPLAMKNKHQKKGFNVFMKVQSKKEVKMIQDVFVHFLDWFKCDVALPKDLPEIKLTKDLPSIEIDDMKFADSPVSRLRPFKSEPINIPVFTSSSSGSIAA